MSTVEKVDKNVVSFEFTVSADEFEKGVEKAYRKNVRAFVREKLREKLSKDITVRKFFMKMRSILFFPMHTTMRLKRTTSFPLTSRKSI